MQTLTNYTGIDISKSFFDVAVGNDGKYDHYQFSNDQVGYNAPRSRKRNVIKLS